MRYPIRRLNCRVLTFAVILGVSIALAQTPEQNAPGPRLSGRAATTSRQQQELALRHLASTSGLGLDELSSIYLAKEYRNPRNGVDHLVYRQRFHGIDVENAAYVVNLSSDGDVLNSGGSLFPEPAVINFGSQVSADIAVRTAALEVNSRLAAEYVPRKVAAAPTSKSPYAVRFAGSGFGADVDGRLVWYVHRSRLLLAWVFNIVDEDGASSYDVAIEAATGAVIEKTPTTFFQSAPRGFVFDKGSPQPNPSPGIRLDAAPPVIEREAVELSGDSIASPRGWVVNAETAGFNAIVSENLLGQTFLPNPRPTQAVSGGFFFPLALGRLAPNSVTFPDSANVNLFYWINRAHDLFYAAGFDEVAGNFQADNYGRGGTAGDAMLAYTHFGSASPFSPALNNAFFTTRSSNDGGASMIAMYATMNGPGGFFSDGAYAADVIIHEYTHGVSLRLLPDAYGSFQTSAMGEAWSDFFGLEFLLPDSSPTDGIYPSGEYFLQLWGTGGRTRPFSTDTKINPLTYSSLGHVIFNGPEVHADGEIWVEALWEARANLIRQFGEAEGRRRIRQLVLDGMTLSVPSATMIEARDAILLADRVVFDGASQAQLWNAFARRGMGALAYSDGGDTVHVISSFDVPMTAGKLRFYEDTFVAGEPVRVILADSNLKQPTVPVRITTTSGDDETLIMRRNGSTHFGLIPSSTAVVTQRNGIVNMVPGDSITASYRDEDSGASVTSGFLGNPTLDTATTVEATASTQQPYAQVSFTSPVGLPAFASETRLTNFRAPVRVDMPFDFPFFSKKYRSMTVFPTGVIAFEPSIFTNLLRGGCNDTTELSRIAGIAPLFSNLTFGNVQPNEGLFLSTSTNSLTLHWVAETVGAAEPVNFATTLTADGTITFHYGPGNENFHAGPPLSTCGPQPTVGISNGHDVYARTIALRSYNNVTPIAFRPPFGATTNPEIILERPASGETVQGILRVSGIAYEPGLASGTFLSRRDVIIDDVARALAAPVARPDYCGVTPVPGCPNVGLQADLNLDALGLGPGPHTIRVRVSNTRGGSKDSIPVTFNVDAGQARLPTAVIETPATGAELSGSVSIRGYAFAQTLRISLVDLLIDGVTYPGITYGAPRPEVCETLPSPAPNCPGVGWTLTLNTRSGSPPLPDGPHSMQLRVLDETGRFTLFPEQPTPFRVRNGPQTLPVGALTSIKPNDQLSGVVAVSGHAYSPVGAVTSIILLVDGAAFAVAQYGEPRAAECAALPAIAACPNIGFTVNLETRLLTNGDHVIGVRIVNNLGLSVTVPNQVRNGMNVQVNNSER